MEIEIEKKAKKLIKIILEIKENLNDVISDVTSSRINSAEPSSLIWIDIFRKLFLDFSDAEILQKNFAKRKLLKGLMTSSVELTNQKKQKSVDIKASQELLGNDLHLM